jgi:hypothetical protein
MAALMRVRDRRPSRIRLDIVFGMAFTPLVIGSRIGYHAGRCRMAAKGDSGSRRALQGR